jgi:riboflavin synthase alpha subunit
LGKLEVGSQVNLEVDAIAKYVERILAFAPPKGNS